MALPRRHSRSVTVNGAAYRWQIRRNTDCPTCGGGSTFVVLHEAPQGALLVVETAHHALPVVPAVVRGRIRAALRQGWQPTNPGRPFRLRTG